MATYQEQFHGNQPSWPFYNVINSTLDQAFMDPSLAAAANDDFSSSFTLPHSADDDMDMIIDHHFSSMLTADHHHSPSTSDDGFGMITLSTDELLVGLDRFDPNLSDSSQRENNNQDGYWSPTPSILSAGEDAISPMEVANPNPGLEIPREESELGNQISVFHLLKAYGEAMEGGHRELGDVIMANVSEKISPAGDPLERLAFNLSQDLRKEVDYIKQEALKNFESAFRAFYQIFPYGRFAHFAANSAMIESIPADAETIHIVDFDIGEGIQWPPVIEALARMGKNVKLTAVAWEAEATGTDLIDSDWAPAMWNFSEVKRRLMDHSSRIGLNFKIESTRIEDLAREIKGTTREREEWTVFNCMVGLPHMRRVRSRKFVEEFLSTANESVAESRRGMVTRGDGEAWENLKGCYGFGAFFEGNMVYYKSLLESIELNFPELAEARMALECLFVAPFISSEAWFQRWVEMSEEMEGAGRKEMEKWRVSKESLEEAKEMVKESQTSYGVRIGGESENEMVLEWKVTPLVRVSSTWSN